MAITLDGKALAAKCKSEIKADVSALCKLGVRPRLAVILVGNDPASQTYVKNKEKDCAECGIYTITYRLPEDTSELELLDLLHKLCFDESVHGVLVQLPLPKHINTQKVLRSIDPRKDVDCFSPYNLGKLYAGEPDFEPCTPAGIIRLLDEYNISIDGKHCVIVGRGDTVGKPLSLMMTKRNATVTLCHSHTPYLEWYTKGADILVSAVGIRNLITSGMVTPDTVVVDVAMNRDENGKLCGDVEYDAVSKTASYITPVPGGVGPMTRVMLLKNVVKACSNYINKNN